MDATGGGRGRGSPLASELLVALEASHPDGKPCFGPDDDIAREEGDESLAHTLSKLTTQASNLTGLALASAVCDLSLVMYQLRAWYSIGLGLLVLALLERVAAQRERLPSPSPKDDPGMAALRLLEGVSLLCTAQHAPEDVARCVENLLARRRLPPGTSVRLEAAVARLASNRTWPGVPPPVWLESVNGEEQLVAMADRLAPGPEIVERITKAKAAIEEAVGLVFPGVRPDYFGSSVNGFETHASDIDCVLQLEAANVDRLLSSQEAEADGDPDDAAAAAPRRDDPGAGARRKAKQAAAVGARMLGEAIRTDERVQCLGLKVVEVIESARVPLLKCVSAEGVAIDVSFNNRLPLHNSRLLRAYATLDQRVQRLGRLVKWWAKRRQVNDAHEGTLSGYSHILLVIHYLQHVGLVPNLQDKAAVEVSRRAEVGVEELVDGVHDVWFMDPHCEGSREAMAAWTPAESEASLRGLLAGFFRYYAYEFPAHSHVVSIRHPVRPKTQYFRAVAAAKQAVASRLEEAAEDDAADGGPDAAAEEDRVPQASEEGEEEDPALTEVAEGEVEASAAPPAPAQEAVRRPGLVSEEQQVQHDLNNRQVLCIDDPMELGRTLGCKFQGMERLSFELRRGCVLLQESRSSKELEELFSDCPPPPASMRNLMDTRNFPSISGKDGVGGVVAKVKQKLVVPRSAVGRIVGAGGANIRQMEQGPGNLRVHVRDVAGTDEAEVHISGDTTVAVDRCATRVRELADDGGRRGPRATPNKIHTALPKPQPPPQQEERQQPRGATPASAADSWSTSDWGTWEWERGSGTWKGSSGSWWSSGADGGGSSSWEESTSSTAWGPRSDSDRGWAGTAAAPGGDAASETRSSGGGRWGNGQVLPRTRPPQGQGPAGPPAPAPVPVPGRASYKGAALQSLQMGKTHAMGKGAQARAF